jgi:AcrR family transcriptional regulator
VDDSRKTRGERRRDEILARAVDLASVDGLEGLTIGRLADELAMSKSGVFAHFGSKEELQLAAIDAAVGIFAQRVLVPAISADPGLPRVRVMLSAWLDYLAEPAFEGGCFFSATTTEFDGRGGPVRDRLVELTNQWLGALSTELRLAQRLGELSEQDTGQLLFELHAFLQEANWAKQLLGDTEAIERARLAIGDRLSKTIEGSRR